MRNISRNMWENRTTKPLIQKSFEVPPSLSPSLSPPQGKTLGLFYTNWLISLTVEHLENIFVTVLSTLFALAFCVG
jgi:hypothetical protein